MLEKDPENTAPSRSRKGTISIDGIIEEYEIDPDGIETSRRDIFQNGYFSVFDVLAHTCIDNHIGFEAHFDHKLRTHVIDLLNGEENWWYATIYHGGGRLEEPLHRMDIFPYKDYMKIRVYKVAKEKIDEIHSVFKAEARRLESNNGRVIVPEVIIDAPNLRFADVEVRDHGLRNDMFQEEVLTSLDIMLSLVDQGKLSLDLSWMENFGTAIVQSYWITKINQQKAAGRIGFTYELGEKRFINEKRVYGNNRLHINPDIRVIIYPEYIHWDWTDLSRYSLRPLVT